MNRTGGTKEDSLQHSNHIELLRTFSKDEIREFDKFVCSPFHNNRKDVIRYYSEVKNFHPAFDSKNLTREKIFIKLFPGEKYDDATMRLLGSKLMAAAESYLSYKTLMKDQFLFKINFMKNLISRKLEKIYDKTLKETERELEREKKKNGEYFEKRAQLESTKNIAIGELLHFKTKAKSDIYGQVAYFLDYSLINIIKGYLNIKNQGTIYSARNEHALIEKIVKLLEDYDFERNPVLHIFLLFLKLADDPDNEELFFKLHDELVNNFEKFDINEFRGMHIELTNYCDYKIFRGKFEFKKIKFDLFKEKVKYGLHLNERGEFLDFSFIRYIEAACLNRDFEWAENFINKYGPLLNPLDRNNVVNFAWSNVECVRENFDKSLEHLSKTNFKDIIEKMQSKVLYLRCYYETKSFNEALSLIDSVRHTINSKKEDPHKHLSPHLRQCYGNYFNYLEKLIKIRLGESKMSTEELKKKIMTIDKIFDRNWFLRKINELINE